MQSRAQRLKGRPKQRSATDRPPRPAHPAKENFFDPPGERMRAVAPCGKSNPAICCRSMIPRWRTSELETLDRQVILLLGKITLSSSGEPGSLPPPFLALLFFGPGRGFTTLPYIIKYSTPPSRIGSSPYSTFPRRVYYCHHYRRLRNNPADTPLHA